MIENQSDNIDNKENDVSKQGNAPEDISSTQNSNTDNDELSSQKTEELNTEELKNTISNNDARLEQLEKEHETLKNQYVRISACLLYTSPSPRDDQTSRMPSSA